ncbi:Cilia- and flagella-associated protein 20 [Lucilia cuprina]|nr:Cilia- and flagella-associated protein 20 [Lucilia cuprina]
MPMRLDEGWNQIQSNFTRRAYVYFSDRLYSEDELPPEFKLFLPIQKPMQKSPVQAICS